MFLGLASGKHEVGASWARLAAAQANSGAAGITWTLFGWWLWGRVWLRNVRESASGREF
jgi:hypothetical protein